jgi:hypothetical protein
MFCGHLLIAIPDRILCCGRPLYDYGMVPRAKRWLEEILEALGARHAAAAGIQQVGRCARGSEEFLRRLNAH